jgi:hypothetical protein
MTAKQRKERITAILERIGITDPEHRLERYPHEFSGGMRQRIMIAGAMLLRPELIIADEPTTALDALIQKEVLDLLMDLCREPAQGEAGAIVPPDDYWPRLRGLGLLLGMEFPTDGIGYRVAGGLFSRGVLTAGTLTNSKNIRFEPALNIPQALLDEALNRIEDVFQSIETPKRKKPVYLYAGRVLHVDLTTRQIGIRPIKFKIRQLGSQMKQRIHEGTTEEKRHKRAKTILENAVRLPQTLNYMGL